MISGYQPNIGEHRVGKQYLVLTSQLWYPPACRGHPRLLIPCHQFFSFFCSCSLVEGRSELCCLNNCRCAPGPVVQEAFKGEFTRTEQQWPSQSRICISPACPHWCPPWAGTAAGTWAFAVLPTWIWLLPGAPHFQVHCPASWTTVWNSHRGSNTEMDGLRVLFLCLGVLQAGWGLQQSLLFSDHSCQS